MLNEKKVKCLKCNQEVIGNKFSSNVNTCGCGKIVLNGATIVEGVEGKDYVDISARLLNENA